MEEDVTALGLLLRSADRNQERSDSGSKSEEFENDEVLVSEGEEFGEADESTFAELMAGTMGQSIVRVEDRSKR